MILDSIQILDGRILQSKFIIIVNVWNAQNIHWIRIESIEEISQEKEEWINDTHYIVGIDGSMPDYQQYRNAFV